MTPEQRQRNLERIAVAAVVLEEETGIPAELTTGQVIIESGWLAKAPGNNPFGIKAATGAKEFQVLETREELTDRQITQVAASGRRIVSMGPKKPNGYRDVQIQDRFATYPSLEAAFRAYGQLLLTGRWFRARTERFKNQHRDLGVLIRDMSGADGNPPYFTDRSYVALFERIVAQSNVKAALAAARAARQQSTTGDSQ